MASVCIIGAGSAGLIPAKTLLDDGFEVHVLTRDRSPGGIWAEERVYPGLSLNNVHGEFRFSCLPMPPPQNAKVTGGRLAGDAISWVNESYSSGIAFWNYPQLVDDLLEDMGLPIMRGGGNWLTWPFKVIDLREIEHLHDERLAKRRLSDVDQDRSYEVGLE